MGWGFRKSLGILIFCGLLTAGVQANAQNKVVDSLQRQLAGTRPDTNRIKLLASLAFHFRVFDPVKAQRFRNEAWALSHKLNFEKGKGWYYYLEGVNLTYQNKFLPAVKAETKAIILGIRVKDYDLVGRAYNTIGVNHLRLEDDSSAMNAFITAIRYINHSTDQAIKPALFLNIGQLYAKLKKYPEALSYYNQSRKIYLSMNDSWGLSLSYLETGKVYAALQDYDKAIVNGNLSFASARQAKYPRTIVNALILLGSSHLAENNLKKARGYLKRAADSAKLVNMHDEKFRIYNGYASLSEKEGNYKDAFFYKRKAVKLSDSIFNVNRSKLTLEYQEKFQIQQKETENKLLRDQQITVQNRFKQRNQILYLTIVVLLGFVVFLLMLFLGNKHIRKSNHRLTEQKNQIQEQKDNVEQLNQIKDKLFSLIAHDLRSPFASMKSMMDMYDEGSISKEDLDFFFKEIRKDIGFNSLLLDNLLIWAKSQLYGFNIDPKPVSVERLVDQVLYHFKKHLEGKEISVKKSILSGSVVYADYEMTNSVVRNLIGNAIKFTPKNGSINIRCIERDNDLQIEIADSGIGISEENKEKIFQDIFFTTQGLNKEKGTGLGLQICKEFIEKNNGKIWVESQVGIGSTFCFTLPRSAEPAEIYEAEPENDVNEAAQSIIREGIKGNISLQMKYDRYELLSKVSLETIWETDLLSGEISWSEALNTNFGYPNERTTFEWWNEKVHPDDFDRVNVSRTDALNEKRDTWSSEYRFQCADGIYRYVFDRGIILYDDNKNPFRLMGIMQNIDAQKNALNEIQRLSLVATNVNNMVVITDADDKVVWVNNAFVKHTGYTLVEMIGEEAQKLLSGPDTDQQVLSKMKTGLMQKEDFSAELINYTRAGKAYWVQIDTTPYRDPITNKTGYVSVQTIITERKENERTISEQNRTLRQIAYICSHDVQSPLYSILRLIKILNNSDTSRTDFEEAIVLLSKSAEKLDSLIYEIHNQISKIERERV